MWYSFALPILVRSRKARKYRNESQGMSAKSSLRINFFSSIWDVSISTIPLSCSSTTASVRPFSSEMLVDDPDGDIFSLFSEDISLMQRREEGREEATRCSSSNDGRGGAKVRARAWDASQRPRAHFDTCERVALIHGWTGISALHTLAIMVRR